MTLVNRETGEACSQVLNTVTRDNLRETIESQVAVPESHLETDKSKMYHEIGQEFASHEAVDHSRKEYVRYVDGRDVGSNPAESYFAQLKRSIDGTHHHVSPEHLHRYVTQFDFMFSTNKMTDDARMRKLVGEIGPGRLTYRPLTSEI